MVAVAFGPALPSSIRRTCGTGKHRSSTSSSKTTNHHAGTRGTRRWRAHRVPMPGRRMSCTRRQKCKKERKATLRRLLKRPQSRAGFWRRIWLPLPASSVPADRPDVALDFLANAAGRYIPRLVLVRDAKILPGVGDIFVTHVEAAGAKTQPKTKSPTGALSAPESPTRARAELPFSAYPGSIPTTRPRPTTTKPWPIRKLLVTLIPLLIPSLELASPMFSGVSVFWAAYA